MLDYIVYSNIINICETYILMATLNIGSCPFCSYKLLPTNTVIIFLDDVSINHDVGSNTCMIVH